MSGSKRPSTSSLRRFITSRPYVPVAEIRRRFGLDDPDAMSQVVNNGTCAFVGLPEREAGKLQDLWERGEIGLELSVEVRAPVVVGIYPMRIARYVIEQATTGNGATANGHSARHSSNGGAQPHGERESITPPHQAPGQSAPTQAPQVPASVDQYASE